MTDSERELVARLRERFVYNDTDGHLYRRTARGLKQAGRMATNGYRRISFDGKEYAEHWLVWALHKGALPTITLDHINRVPTDNRIENLRLADARSQQGNRPVNANNKSGARGVYWRHDHGKWVARICLRVNGKNRPKHIGEFDTVEKAKAAYDAAAKQYFGEFYQA